MARIPKHKQVINPVIDGILVNPTTKVVYRGPYVRDYRQRYYEGTEASFNDKLLEFIPNNPDTSAEELDNAHRMPTEADYDRGVFERFFVKDRRNNKIVEIDKDRFTKERTAKKIYRVTYKLNWIIKGRIDDYTFDNGYSYPGVASRNKELIRIAEKVVPGIGQQVLFNPKQFVVEE